VFLCDWGRNEVVFVLEVSLFDVMRLILRWFRMRESMGRRLKLQSKYVVRVSTAGESGVHGDSFLARLRISQPKEMAIEESMQLQEREVIRGG
jgi:hypothetical protein